MKISATQYTIILFILLLTGGSNCSKQEQTINYENGIFPEETINLEGINSQYDDYNIALPQVAGELPLMFSSNRNSQGSDFDIVSGLIYFVFSQIDGEFTLQSSMISEPFYQEIEQKVNTGRNELGPYRFFNGSNGLEYFIYSEEDDAGMLNFKYLSYSPSSASKSAPIDEPVAVSSLNSNSNDAYFCVNKDLTAAFFTTDRQGNYDIVSAPINDASLFDLWLEGDALGINVTDSINSDYDDKCPFIRNNLMIFASNRPGGLGGYDLYYSVYRDDKWSSPLNMGPGINTEYNEYRPVVASYPDFTNDFMLFSSDRPSGQGGYDLYFRGIDLGLLTE